jgi:hypothetical protein
MNSSSFFNIKTGKPYVGKALGSLIQRYGSAKVVAELGIDVIKGLDQGKVGFGKGRIQ